MAANPVENEVDLTLFVACYNEEQNIVGTLETVLAALQEFDFTWEIIIIDDGSTDRSVEVIQDFLHEHPDLPIMLRKRESNVGLGENFIEAAFMGRGKYYRMICGDNVEPKETLVEVFKHLGAADMVLFYHDVKGKSLSRRILSRCYTWLVNLITGYHVQYYNGMALHRRYNVMRWHTNYHGFGFQADMIAACSTRASTTSRSLQGHERKTGISHALTLRNFFSVTHTLLDLFIRRVVRWRRTARRRRGAARCQALAASVQVGSNSERAEWPGPEPFARDGPVPDVPELSIPHAVRCFRSFPTEDPASARREHDLDLSIMLPLDVPPPDFHHPAMATLGRGLWRPARGRARILLMGAHVLRAGVSRHLIDLMERGLLSTSP